MIHKLGTFTLHILAIGFIAVFCLLYGAKSTYDSMTPIIEERVIKNCNMALHEEGYRRFNFIVEDTGTVKLRIAQRPVIRKGP